MIDPRNTEDPNDVKLAFQAVGLLGEYNVAEVLTAADVHVAVTVGRLAGETDELVLLAVALAVRGVRQGSVCIDLAEQHHASVELNWPEPRAWAARVQASVLVTGNGPLRWDLGLLYLDRYWWQEIAVCADLLGRVALPAPGLDETRLQAGLDRLFPEADLQRMVAEVAARRWITVLGGGPGTGKTFTIARLLALLLDQPGPALRMALAAPTGKAAARLQEAVQEVSATFDTDDQERLGGLTASTMHRLLGSRPGYGNRFKHNRDNRLPFDVIVIDETSMVSLSMMARLLEAVRPDARLILVGDPDQLASVEAGAVLADLVAGLTARPGLGATPAATVVADDSSRHGVVVLQNTFRFSGGIARLATAVRSGDGDGAVAILTSGAAGVSFDDGSGGGAALRTDVLGAAAELRSSALAGDARGALNALGRHRVLCAHRTGPYGVAGWSWQIERWIAESRGGSPSGEWYVGRPLLVTANDYLLGLYNGDTGVVIAGPDSAPLAAFARGLDVVTFAPSRLSEVQTVHAMTVHRSQGSQFAAVTLVLPEPDSPLLTREMLYTGLTRAQHHVRIVCTEQAFREAVARPAARASGLRERLARG